MKLIGYRPLLLATGLLLASPHIHALDVPHHQGEAPCHSLMTELECQAFRVALTSLPSGDAWNRFMAEHTALMREREALCNCSRANADTIILYPRVEQVAQSS